MYKYNLIYNSIEVIIEQMRDKIQLILLTKFCVKYAFNPTANILLQLLNIMIGILKYFCC